MATMSRLSRTSTLPMTRFTVAAAVLALLAALPACGGDEKDGKKDPTGTAGGGGMAPQPPPGMVPSPNGGGYGYAYAAASLGEDLAKKVGDSLQKARQFLAGQRDATTGGWGDASMGGVNVGTTALGVVAFVATTPRESVASDPFVTQGLEFLAKAQKVDGSIHDRPQVANYQTSAAVAAFAAARVAKYATVQAKARDFLEKSQVAGDEKDANFGGFPYQSQTNPDKPTDLSNAQFAATALREAALPADSPVWKRLLTYLSRVQNRSETNTFAYVTKEGQEIASGNDGGAYYSPGESKVGPPVKRADGKFEFQSYGSMTYALLKCLLFAGVRPEDPRVQAAVQWISSRFTVDRNPGFEAASEAGVKGQQGYYYYTVTMARALAEYEKATGKPLAVTDADGRSHAWRKDLAAKLVSLQKPDGSWVNEVADRWDEGSAVLATEYVVQALALCQGRLP